MKIQSGLTQPLQLFFTILLVLGLGLLSALVWSLYQQGLDIKNSMEVQTQAEAKQELVHALQHTYSIIESQLEALSEWDEVHQQFLDPSYYFFWHDERLKESYLFQPYYDAFELYQSDKQLLMPASPTSGPIHASLPTTIDTLEAVVKLDPNIEAHVTMFHPIQRRGSEEILGWIGISFDLERALFEQNQFFYLDKQSLILSGNQTVPYSELMQYIQFQPISNPVNSYMWELIQTFILELTALLLIITLLIIVIFYKLIQQPIGSLTNYLQRLKSTPQETHPPLKEHFYVQEFENLKETLHSYHAQLHATQSELDQQNDLVWEQARRDALTNVYNRRAFDETWNVILTSNEEADIPTAFILFDCDFFKALNDTYGHEVGDEVIRLTAETLQKNLPMESPPYRIGGDEFAVIVQHRPLNEVELITQHCLQALQNAPFQSLGIKEKLSFSVGISAADVQQCSYLAQLPRQADIAMYKAKQQSQQNKIQVYTQLLEDESRALVSNQVIETILEAIHSGDRIQMHYQPVSNLTSHDLYYESLIRIEGEEGLIYPNDIFTLVSRRRLEVELDHQVIKATLKALEQGRVPRETGLSINISGKTLLQPELVELFKPFIPWLKQYKIVIEITENILIDHIEYAQTVLNQLRHKGFYIALDDFGSGYSSIRYLAHMPVDIIKFDMSMTQALQADSKTQKIIQSTAKMVRQSGFDLVMEGVETEEMLQQAKQAGATHIQGYLLGRPQPTFEPLITQPSAS